MSYSICPAAGGGGDRKAGVPVHRLFCREYCQQCFHSAGKGGAGAGDGTVYERMHPAEWPSGRAEHITKKSEYAFE